jgi:menaquinone-dependent protoporphyrinogen oxidase
MGEKRKLSRRGFLTLAGGAVGTTTLACCGLSRLTTQQPDVEFTESSCGEAEGAKRVLIAYGSKCGSTGGIAETIGQMLCDAGAAVDVRLVKDVGDLGPYQAVIVGSAIRQGRLLPEVVESAETHGEALNRLPVACFVACLTMVDDTEENQSTVSAYLDPLRELVQPVSEGLFPGALDYGKISLPEQVILRMMGSSEGDFRDWEAIRGWADGLRVALLST